MAIFRHGDGWALLISVFTKQIEVAACPSRQGQLAAEEPRERQGGDGPHPKCLTCHRPAPSGQARVCVCVRVCVTKIEREREGG